MRLQFKVGDIVRTKDERVYVIMKIDKYPVRRYYGYCITIPSRETGKGILHNFFWFRHDDVSTWFMEHEDVLTFQDKVAGLIQSALSARLSKQKQQFILEIAEMLGLSLNDFKDKDKYLP